MIVVERKVYYCEYCKRHRMTASAIEKHEPRCIYNPNRSACGWHDDRKAVGEAPALAAEYRRTLDTDWLRRQVDECPACMLAVVVQAGLSSGDRHKSGFDYATEVERYRTVENRHAF